MLINFDLIHVLNMSGMALNQHTVITHFVIHVKYNPLMGMNFQQLSLLHDRS